MRGRSGSGARFLPGAVFLLLAALGGCGGARLPETEAPVFFPAAPAAPRVQYLTQFSTAADVMGRPGALSRLLLGANPPDDVLAKPYGLALDRGRLYVCDTKLDAVVVFDLAARRFGYCGTTGPQTLKKPVNICADPDGRKFIADAGRGEVVILDAQDTWAGAFGGRDLQRPVDVAWRQGRIYVCDAEACRVVVFDGATLAPVAFLGGPGEAAGQFARPTNLAVDPEGNIYVSDTLNGRIQKISPTGEFLAVFGSRGDRPGEFARPKGIALDPAGRLLAVDAAFENVQLFDASGRLLLFFGGPGTGPGQFTLPAQVVVDTAHLELFAPLVDPGFTAECLVLVSSQYGPRKISVFALGQARQDAAP